MARWAAATPDDFRFALKAPKTVTHEARLVDCAEPMARFLAQADELGPKLGPVLLQLPPSLAFDAEAAGRFFATLREMFGGQAVCEPRHPTWFDPDADALLTAYRIARVAADPARVPAAAIPGGWPDLAYWRLHGSPRMYFSAYDDAALGRVGEAMAASASAERWCIFDNTASGAAAADALRLGAGTRSSAPSV